MDKTFNFDLREFYGNNNSPKTQRLIESAYKKPRRSRAEDVSLPDLEEYKPQITMADIPRLQTAGKAPERDEPGEAKSRAIATGVAALLGILGGGDVARSAVAGYTGMKTGQDRMFASREKNYLTKQKQLMDQFNSENKSFGNQLGFERLLQGGVNTRNQQKMGLTGLQMQQARAGDAAETAGLNLDLRYDELAQRKSAKANPMQDPKVNAAVAEYKRLGDALTNPTILKTMTNEQIGVFQKRRDELGKFLGFSGGLGQVTRAGLSDKEKADANYKLQSLGLRGAAFEFAKRRWAEDAPMRQARIDNIQSLLADRLKRGKLSTGQVININKMYGIADETMAEGRRYYMYAETGKAADGTDLSPEQVNLYKEIAKDKFIEAGRQTERANKLLGIGSREPGAAKLGTGRQEPLGIKPTILSGGVKVTPQKPKVTPKPINQPQGRAQKQPTRVQKTLQNMGLAEKPK